MTSGFEGRSELLDKVVDAVGGAYYEGRVRSGTSARTRAQTAGSTITLFAGGLVAALTFTALAGHPLATRAAGVFSVLLWLCAAMLYVWAISLPVHQLVKIREATDADDFVAKVLHKADIETDEVDKRQKWATRTAIAALSLSALTFALAVLVGPAEKSVPGMIILDQKGLASLTGACRFPPPNPIEGSVKEATLTTSFVEIAVKRDTCAPGVTVLRIPRASIKTIGSRE
ncbi:hypothetical protein HD597_006073 [Nonomuraea thailandensis]|uniref:Uncharacterized protein n=1 Tax=Nonomuraea thailandensis TaxID=1188745 RepID=A0A9X2GRD1_9ACTN|nr:hypothetical protein [Nonomuraea thailandensis]MCP2359053.1 hypothetical protein [Nonomuraea thailandensis]